MMRRGVTKIWLALSLGGLAQQALGQTWDYDLELGFRSGLEWNVFHSPEVYIDNAGNIFLADSIVLDDILAEGVVDLEMERADANGAWIFQGEVDNRRYSVLREANRRSLEFRATREQRLSDEAEAYVSLRLRDETRLGLNILGDELLTSFSFFQAQGDLGLEFQARDNVGVACEFEASRKWFDAQATGKSLDQTEWMLEVAGNWVPYRRKTGLRNLDLVGQKRTESLGELSAFLMYRQKDYLYMVNYDVLAAIRDPLAPDPFMPFDPAFSYPLRRWVYASAALKYDFPEWGPMQLRLDVRRQTRSDESMGDFGYKDFKTALRLAYEGEDLEISGSASYTHRNYTDRLAEQAGPTPYPLLTYTYLRLDLGVEYRLRKGLLLTGLIDFTDRGSNTTALDRRTRREYVTGAVLIGISAEIKS
jgi:hypothetical protein